MQHDHIGDATYVAYTLGCRHPHCREAAREYKRRLAERKLKGEFHDLRRRVAKLYQESAEDEAVPAAEEPRSASDPTIPAIESAPGSAESEAAEEPLNDVTSEPSEREKVLHFLRLWSNHKTRRVMPEMLGIMPRHLGVSPEVCQRSIDALAEDGLLASDGKDLYFVEQVTSR